VTLFVRKFIELATAALTASFVAISFNEGAMSSSVQNRIYPPARPALCEEGFHVGPAGTCVLGAANPTSPRRLRPIW
jgi:hypothetical protein